MQTMQQSTASLAAFVDNLQAGGSYTFTRDNAANSCKLGRDALQKAARRLVLKKRLCMPREGFFVVVPLEYLAAGAPPPSWFVADLMRFVGQPYYVGLLSAAALHGAAHQQPQEFQVVTNKALPVMRAGRARLRFVTKKHIDDTPTTPVKTETGTMRVATPEATALDLVRYVRPAGHLDNVATVLAELADHLDAHRLVDVAKKERELACVQRLGYLLDFVGASSVTAELADWLARRAPRAVPLRPSRAIRGLPRDPRWRILVNTEVHPDVESEP